MKNPRHSGTASADLRRTMVARGVRGLASGYLSVVIGVELHRQGLSGLQIGFVLGAILGGAAIALLTVRHFADKAGRRRMYVGGYLAQAAAGLVLVLSPVWWLVALIGLTGAMSGEIVDSGALGSLEQVMLATAMRAEHRLRAFSRYGAVGAATGALGALGAGLLEFAYPGAVGPSSYIPIIPLAAIGAMAAWGLSPHVEHGGAATASEAGTPVSSAGRADPATRRVVRRLSGLFALDSFGAGFAVQAYVAYWLAARFNANTLAIGVIFLGLGVLQTLSMQVAGRLGEKFGLLETMVFTHLPFLRRAPGLRRRSRLSPLPAGCIDAIRIRFPERDCSEPEPQGDVVHTLQDSRDKERRARRDALDHSADHGSKGASEKAREAGGGRRVGPVLRGDERHDVRVARRNIHLGKESAQGKQCGCHREVGSECDGGQEHV